MLKKRVLVGLSGGVDSSVAAFLLKEQGFDVISLFMINWKDSSVTLQGQCSWEEDLIVAQLVAKKLSIPLEVIDNSQMYYDAVVEYMFSEYQSGRTPNPDILCNREIKFKIFAEYAQKFDAQYIATGHYSLTQKSGNYTKLLTGIDKNKDQSYFLCQLNQKHLQKTLFPLGNLFKHEVRKIAIQQSLASATKKDSQGICFIGKVDLPIFLQQKIFSKNGDVVYIQKENPYNNYLYTKSYDNVEFEQLEEISKPYNFELQHNKVIGKHQGVYYYTIGQRKGLDIGGTKEALYIVGNDIDKNIIYVGEGQNHWALYKRALFIAQKDLHWIIPEYEMKIFDKRKYQVRIRYRQELQNACLYRAPKGMYIVFENYQRGITPGQYAVWYKDNELIGSGIINY